MSYSFPGHPHPRLAGSETLAQRTARLERERALLDEARAQLAAGQGIDIDDPQMEAWLDGLDSDDAPPPEPRTVRSSGR